ncbi:MAG: helix-turn-helix transcriptional regulator [Paludibacteraceae bacterium]|nr:helix-turn-helix transcriptional regulator [Paludibacteraceae bacterium]
MKKHIKDRLKEFLEHLGMGQNKFEAHVGIANGYIASKSITMSSDILEKIKAKYPELDIDWLITGDGEMLIKESTTQELYISDSLIIPAPAIDIMRQQSETILSQQRTIEKLTK